MSDADAALFDPSYLAELDAMLGAAVTDTLVAPMLYELGRVPSVIADFLSTGDVAAARSAAHGLRGAAMGLGCVGVADVCARLETETADVLPSRAAALGSIAVQTAAALRTARS